MKIQHFYVNPAILLSGIWTINYFKHRDTTRRNYQPDITRILTLGGTASVSDWWCSCDVPVMFLMTEVRSWVSLQLFGLSPWDLGLPGSRHSEACPHTENTNLYATMTPQPQPSSNSSSGSTTTSSSSLSLPPITTPTTTMMPPKSIGSSMMRGWNE